MADRVSSLAKDLEPYIADIVRRMGAGGAGGAGLKTYPIAVHALNDTGIHTGSLDVAQFPQGLLVDGSRALTGNLSVAGGVLIDGVDIDVHAANPDAHHKRAAGVAGITIDPNQNVSIDLATPWSGLSLALNKLQVDLAAAFTWTGQHQFNVSPKVNADLNFIGVADRTITAQQKLTLAPTGNLALDPGGLITLPDAQEMRTDNFSDLPTGISGFRLWDRGGNYRQLTIGALKADELYVRVFVADETRIDRGEEYWSKSYGVVQEDFVTPADEATVDVWFEDSPGLVGASLFSVGDWLLFRTIDRGVGLTVQKSWYQVVSLVANDDSVVGEERQRWRIRRKVGGTTGFVIKKGNVALDAGQVGQGWVHLSALQQDGGPFIQMGSQTAAGTATAAPVFTNYVRMGNLSGTGDYATDAWGFAAAKNLATAIGSGFEGITVDPNNGVRLFNTALANYSGSAMVVEIERNRGIGFLMDSAGAFSSAQRYIHWYNNLAARSGERGTLGVYDAAGGVTGAFRVVGDGTRYGGLFLTARRSMSDPEAGVMVQAGIAGERLIDLATDRLTMTSGKSFTVGNGVWLGVSSVADEWFFGTLANISSVVGTDRDIWIGSRTNNPVRLLTNGASRLMIAGDGSVGIGTTAPAYFVDAVGSIRARGLLLAKNTGDIGSAALVPGNSAVTGYVEWRLPAADGVNGTRLGYLGWSATDVKLTLENGAGFVVSGGSTSLGATTVNGTLTVGNFGSWTGLAPTSGEWANADTTNYNALAYRKVGDIVFVRGLVKQIGAGVTVAQLPAGFRPAKRYIYACDASSNAHASVEVRADGDIVWRGSGTVTGYLSLDGVWFSTV